MYKITFYYWFESPYTGRATGDVTVSCTEEYDVLRELSTFSRNGALIPINAGLRRYVAPHQLIDTVVELVKEVQEDVKIETPDTPRDEVLPVKTTRSRKAKNTPADGV